MLPKLQDLVFRKNTNNIYIRQLYQNLLWARVICYGSALEFIICSMARFASSSELALIKDSTRVFCAMLLNVLNCGRNQGCRSLIHSSCRSVNDQIVPRVLFICSTYSLASSSLPALMRTLKSLSCG